AWLIHGNFAAFVAAVLVLVAGSDLFGAQQTIQRWWLLDETCYLATLGILILTWAELGRRRSAPALWILVAVGGLAVLTPPLVLAQQSAVRMEQPPIPPLKVSLQRVQQSVLFLYVAGGLLGAWQAYRRRTCHRGAVILAAALALLMPAAAFGVAR